MQTELELVAESIPHMVWMASPDGETDYFNTQGTDYTGFPRQKNYGWGWVSLVHDDDAERARHAWRDATSAQTPFEMTYRIRRRDGEYLWFTGRARPVRSADGTIMRWIGTAVDVDAAVRRGDRLHTIERQTTDLLSLLSTEGDGAALDSVERSIRAIRANALLDDDGCTTVTETPADLGLSARELDVVRLIARGFTNREAANQLAVSLRTVEADRANAMRKLGVGSRATLVRFALDTGLLAWH